MSVICNKLKKIQILLARGRQGSNSDGFHRLLGGGQARQPHSESEDGHFH